LPRTLATTSAAPRAGCFCSSRQHRASSCQQRAARILLQAAAFRYLLNQSHRHGKAFRPLRPADRRILRGFLPPVDGQVEQAVSRRCAQSRGGLGHGLQRVELNRFRASKADQLKRRPLVAQARLGALNPVRVGRFGSGRASLAHAGQAEKVGHHQPEGSHSKDQVTNAVAAAAIHATPPKGHRRLLRNLMGLHEDNARPASRFRLATNPAPVSVGAIPSFCHFTCPGDHP
jgi:hypothetical protein